MPSISRTHKYDELEREFHEFMKKYDPHYKAEKIRINISSTFLVRGRCVECGGPPTWYYQMRKPYLWTSVQSQLINSKWLRQWIKRMTEDWYLDDEPRYFLDIKEFSFTVDDKHYNPALHRTRGSAVGKENTVEFIGCDCGATVWAFNQRSVKNRPEITNRKGRYSYPNKFEH